MITKYYVDGTGAYLGSFTSAPPYDEVDYTDPENPVTTTVTPAVVPPPAGIEVPTPPQDGRQIWDEVNLVWLPLTSEVARETMPALNPAQIRLGLLGAGITEAMVDTEIAAIVDPAERAAAEIEWKMRPTYQRTHALVATIGTAFGLTPEDVDTMWTASVDL